MHDQFTRAFLVKAIERAERDAARYRRQLAAFEDPTHVHQWLEVDGARHCQECGRIQHAPYLEATSADLG
jgi:hypothetical protein